MRQHTDIHTKRYIQRTVKDLPTFSYVYLNTKIKVWVFDSYVIFINENVTWILQLISYFQCIYLPGFLKCLSLLNLKSFNHITSVSIVNPILPIDFKKLNNLLRKINSTGMNETLISLIPNLIICREIKFQLNKKWWTPRIRFNLLCIFFWFYVKKKWRIIALIFFCLPSLPVSAGIVFFCRKLNQTVTLSGWFDVYLSETSTERQKYKLG